MKRKKYIKPEIERIHVEQTLMDSISVPFNGGESVDPGGSEAKPHPGGWDSEDFESAAKWRNLWDDEE